MNTRTTARQCHRLLRRAGSRAGLLLAVLVSLSACDSDSAPVEATCESTCERSVALDCPNEGYQDTATCQSQCEAQIADCDNASIVQAYLDCVETTPMTCGSTTGTASSPECVQQGLAYFACLQGVDTDG